MPNLYCDMNLENTVFSADCNSDPTILFINGSPEEVNAHIDYLLMND